MIDLILRTIETRIYALEAWRNFRCPKPKTLNLKPYTVTHARMGKIPMREGKNPPYPNPLKHPKAPTLEIFTKTS